MKPDPLLEAVFGPGEEILRPALKAARRRRVRHVILRTTCSAACLAAAAWLLIAQTPSRSTLTTDLAPSSPAPRASNVSVVATVALPPHSMILTRPLADNEVVHTQPDSVMTISTANTASRPAIIADAELLALLELNRVALVGSGPNARLVEY